jgi:gas vesicle protein
MRDKGKDDEVVDTAADEEDEDVAAEDHRAGTFLAGLAIGALVGAGVALLFAPQSGEKTRHAVARRARRLARRARARYDDVKDKARRARRELGRAEEDDDEEDASDS